MNFDFNADIIRSCRVLFGPDFSVSREFLFYCLQYSGIKSAFRKKALLTHPDRFILSDPRRKEANDFILIKQARDDLTDFIRKRDKKGNVGAKANKTSEAEQKTKSPYRRSAAKARRKKWDGYHRGPVPSRYLRLGEFLFYKRQIAWNDLIKAIVWQRRQRPCFGKIVIDWRMLNEYELRFVLKRKNLSERLGEVAIRLNLLTPMQVNTVLFRQGTLQNPIGHYFVKHNFLSPHRIDFLLSDLEEHNSLHASKKPM